MKHALLTLALLATTAPSAFAWEAKQAPVMTRWAKDVDPRHPLPDYPRPQMTRKDWLNLNGVWQYQPGAQTDAVPAGKSLSGEILVPYPVESALSGVMEHHDRLWYRRTFTTPSKWSGKHILLHFGAVDWESEVFVNGKSVGVHQGGYDPFTYDVTPYLTGSGPQELIVRVYDPTEAGGQPRGKQTKNPGGIMYTPTTGVWQTVWLEPVADGGVQDLKIVPDVDSESLKLTVDTLAGGGAADVTVKVMDGKRVVTTVTGAANAELTIPVKNPKLWSPETPFLYDLDVSVAKNGKAVDSVQSYFGMRKISVGRVDGVLKMLLNNKFVFELGPLDQGFWPDGIYTAPTDAALKWDIQEEKAFGFNMVRKHIKVEPARWYYWADKLGIMVWQDMPSPDSYIDNPPPVDKDAYDLELTRLVQNHWNSPSIIMWVIFNEWQGLHDVPRIVKMVKTLDPSRLVNPNSGNNDNPETHYGDVMDIHNYPPPNFVISDDMARANGEYGGIGLNIPGHVWVQGGGYTNAADGQDLADVYSDYTAMLKDFRDNKGLSAAVYTQITDVMGEVNGLVTYDRAVVKADVKAINRANHFLPGATLTTVVPTSEKTAQTWKYTTDTPPAGWSDSHFDDSAWKEGPGGFGTAGTSTNAVIGTTWSTSDIWLRRTFNPGALSASDLSHLQIRVFHDEDAEVYINGVKAFADQGYITSYVNHRLTPEAIKAIKPGQENSLAVHCHQTTGGQYIDVGFIDRIPSVDK